MTDATFTPIIYLKQACPFCMKLRIFLLEAGLLDKVQIKQFTPDTDDEQVIRAELTPHFEKISFPTAQINPGKYLNESDAVIDHFSSMITVVPADMPTLRAYADDMMPVIRKMFVENMELKKQVAG